MSILKPLQGAARTFWHCAGDIIYLGTRRPIDRAMAESLREIFADEVKAAWGAGDVKVASHATALWRELTDAFDNHDMWLRLHAVSRRAA